MSIKRTITVISTAVLLLLLSCIYAVSNVYAAQDLKLSMDSIDLDKNEGVMWLDREEYCDEMISKAEPSQEGIIDTDVDEDSVYIAAAGLGDTVLTVTGNEGTVIKVPVHVGEKALKAALEYTSDFFPLYYGDTDLRVDTRAGNKVTVKVGKDTYSGVAKKKKGDADHIDFKLKKVYNYGTKIKYTIEKDGVTYTYNTKIWSGSYVSKAKASKKTLTVTTYNCHKGDVLTVKYAGRKYTKKITKNHNRKSWKCKIKMKKKISKKAKMKVVLKNKYKTTLDRQTVKLKKGKWETRVWC